MIPKRTLISFLLSLTIIIALGFWLFLFTNKLYPLPQFLSPHDLGVFLDHGWRLSQGQMPHRDYTSYLGPLWAFITWLPIYISGPFYDSYVLYPASLALFFSLLALTATFGRMPNIPSTIFSLLIGLVAGGTYHIGYDPDLLTFSTNYNRIGFALISIIGVLAMTPTKAALEKLNGIQAGMLTGALLFLKVNFFAVSLIFVCFGCIASPRAIRTKYSIGLAYGLLLALVVGFASINWSFKGYFRDMSLIAHARSSAHLEINPLPFLYSNSILILFIILLSSLLLFQNKIRAILSTLLIFCSTFLLGLSQSSGNGFALPAFVAAFFVAGCWLTFDTPSADSEKIRIPNFLIWGIVFCVGLWMVAIPQLASYRTWARVSQDAITQFGPPKRDSMNPLGTLLVRGPNFSRWGDKYVSLVNEASQLILPEQLNGSTVHLIDFTNPLNFGHFKSAKHTYVSTDSRINMSESSHLPPDLVLSDVDFLVIAKNPDEQDYVIPWYKFYGDYVRAHYSQVKESENFILLEKSSKIIGRK